MQVDHVFIFVEADGTAITAARSAGLVTTHQRRHHGQGTENQCFGFENAYLEFLWRCDDREIESPAVARTGLAARSRWRQTGACPFGVCLRTSVPPFPTWSYGVPFPAGMTMEMAVGSERTSEPLIFATQPTLSSRASQSRQPLGRRITGIELAYPGAGEPSLTTQSLVHSSIRVRHATSPWMTITLDGGRNRQQVDIAEASLTIVR